MTPCPSCKAGAAAQGHAFAGGYLHKTRSYVGLLRCDRCGAHYVQKSCLLRRIPANQLRDHRR